ncbi:NF-X1 type zinc finger [Dictyocaulus viviparus]|uniref:NF-X1 type zinc finger n=1 Tax=Dictyocaulus viviparus TaxID=29172 RepID=A0A0D8XHX7_DICVI|nr:NF-X1 type zinc finger [Dictyocaulus viviparus]
MDHGKSSAVVGPVSSKKIEYRRRQRGRRGGNNGGEQTRCIQNFSNEDGTSYQRVCFQATNSNFGLDHGPSQNSYEDRTRGWQVAVNSDSRSEGATEFNVTGQFTPQNQALQGGSVSQGDNNAHIQSSRYMFNPNAPPFIPQAFHSIRREPIDIQCRQQNYTAPRFYTHNEHQFQKSRKSVRGRIRGCTSDGPQISPNQNQIRTRGSDKAYINRANRNKLYRSNHRKAQKDVLRQGESMRAITGRLIHQLENRSYECAICCQVILPKQSIWSCTTCYHIFHISGGCITNWAKRSKEDDNGWRCPTCQTKYSEIPYTYFCFCRKQRNPTNYIHDTPHSCGDICGNKRAPNCTHPCNELCHPGPCPECPVMITRSCNCGNIQKTIRCGSVVEIKCDKVCDRLLGCGVHRCVRVCHDGECGQCEVVVQQSCFCGSSSREMLCWEKGNVDNYSCGCNCTGMYKCGVHRCTRKCHMTDEFGCGPCPYSPERISHCPCGRCSLEELKLERLSCSDPIPTCKNVCGKVLECGSAGNNHRCRALCHTGECPPCKLNTCVICRCKQMRRTLTCVEYLQSKGMDDFLCMKRCKKRKSCGIHKCQELCCVQTEHICLQVCNKRLSCGLHFCENICHAGQCPRCLNSSFEEQYCHCGRTMRPPPIPCGSPLPECNELCVRPHRCNHPVTHRCHGDERCPPCTVLVERMCYGNHEMRMNVPCHIDAVSCGRLCEKPLTCGVHYCNRSCHPGDCIKVDEKCSRPCMVLRRSCEHPCALPCHGTSLCPESECQYLLGVTCECGKRRSQMKCCEFVKVMDRLRAIEAEELNESDPLGGIGLIKRSPSTEKLNCMPCDDECKKLARNKKLAEALELVTDDNGDLERMPSITFTEYLKAELRTNASFVLDVELAFTNLIGRLEDVNESLSIVDLITLLIELAVMFPFQPTYLGASLNYNFQPMSLEKRRFIHDYATFFFLTSVSVDDPPKRSVIVTAKRGISRAPLVLLTSLQKNPLVLNLRGSSTLRGNIDEEDRRRSTTGEIKDIQNGSRMKALRGSRPVKKRMAPQIPCTLPLPQFNHFAVLKSDDEEAGYSSDQHPTQMEDKTILATNMDWWDDEERVSSFGDISGIVLLLKELVLKVCEEM